MNIGLIILVIFLGLAGIMLLIWALRLIFRVDDICKRLDQIIILLKEAK